MNTVQCMKSRLMMQLNAAYDDGWYVSFGTLTVDPESKEKVFEAGSDCWRNFIRTIQRNVEIKTYGSVRDAVGQPKCFHYRS